ncbi:hypothetical protein [Flavobacterium suaedae]|nr:hypothetical protein [Flavobacterium suaedae]
MDKSVSINTLRRYKLIVELYKEHKTEDIPTTRVLRKYIYPKYPISRATLYTILNTPVDKLIKDYEAGRTLKMSF